MFETIWIVWLAVFFLIISFVNPVRRNVLSRFIRNKFRKVVPHISKTEEQALLAGTVWWDGELFSGRPDWLKIVDLPISELSENESSFLDGPVEKLCIMLDEWEIVRQGNDLPPEVWKFLKKEGFFGMIIPRRFGGLEFSALAHSAVITKLASRSITAAVTAMVPNSLGPAQLLLRYGTDYQKEYYLRQRFKELSAWRTIPEISYY
jgi:acyl-CoA dehydrogenase